MSAAAPAFPRSRLGLAVTCACGAATVLGFAPFYLFPLPLLTLAWLFRTWERAPGAGDAAASGYAFGLGFFLAGVSWIYVSLHVYGGMPAALAAVATVLFCALLAIFPALAGWLYGRLRQGSVWRRSLLAAAGWTLAEWLRGWMFTGFPWLSLGHSQGPPSPLAGFAPVLGAYGLSFLAALAGAWLGLTWGRGARVFWAGANVVLVLGLGLALGRIQWTQPAGAPLRVSLLQGNIEQSLKWRPELLQRSLQVYLDLARRHPAELVVLPETALPLLSSQLPDEYLRELAAAAPGGDVLYGIVVRDERGRYANSALSAGASPAQRYDKSHLVPFGEFVPAGFGWTLALLSIPMSDFTPAAAPQKPLRLARQRVAVNICYEDVFGAELARALPEATLLVNLSNTAWFGDSLAQPQHLQIAQMRALETGRAMLRATNTGMTAVVGPDGVITHVLPPFTAAALQADVVGRIGATPYVRWRDVPILAVVASALILGSVALRGNRRAGSAVN